MPTSPRILVVDDFEDLAAALADLLRSWGYVVDVASNAAEAVALAQNNLPLVAFIDLELHGEMDGLHVARKLSTLPVSPKMYAISGFDIVSQIDRLREAGFADGFLKPVNWDQLKLLLDQIAPVPS